MLRSLTLILCLSAVPSFADGLRIHVAGEANGVVEIDLFEDIAPKHTAQIRELAEAGFYDGVYFHRVIDGFMAQTGDGEFASVDSEDSRSWGRGGSDLPDIPAEFSDVAFDRGVVGMARAGDPQCVGVLNCQERQTFLDSANSQFFIMFAPGHFLNGNYTVVGGVVSGIEVIDAIRKGGSHSGIVEGIPDRMERVEVIN